MALDAGIIIASTDLEKRGGIKHVYVTELANIATATASSTLHTYTALTMESGKTFFWLGHENETAGMNIALSKENGSTIVETSVELYIPAMDAVRHEELSKITDVPLMLVCLDYNGKYWAIGLDNIFGSNLASHQTYAKLMSAEGGSGAAWSDKSGLTISFSARTGELPREITGKTFTPNFTTGVVALS
tara:strand:- start:1907 stop:2473 length:567 start_codon:yes stop_codon:yes gene_type:complete